MLPVGIDWIKHILPALEIFLQGGNPYVGMGPDTYQAPFPFWTFIILSPLAYLPYWVGRTLLFVISFAAFGYTAYRMKVKHWQVILFMTSAAVIGCLNNGNIDWLVTLGLWMPPWLGLFFVLMKPQVGAGIALFWVFIYWRELGWKAVLKMLAPVSVAYAVSFLLYGLWMFQNFDYSYNNESWDTFPWTIPLGFFLLYYSTRHYDRSLPALGTALLAPYISQFSYSMPMLQLMRRPYLFTLSWILLWIPVGLRFLL